MESPPASGITDETVKRLGAQALDILETCPPLTHSGEARQLITRLRQIYTQENGRPNGMSSAVGFTGSAQFPAASPDPGLVPLSCVVQDHIIRVYEGMGRNKTQAARILEIDIKTLYNKLKRYGYE
jgi:DNA-binding NtrC family response regulator